MSKMVERVAKAIYAEFENRPLYAQAQMNGVIAEECARAAIKAMREPTRAMALAGLHALPFGLSSPLISKRCHRAMIDEALK